MTRITTSLKQVDDVGRKDQDFRVFPPGHVTYDPQTGRKTVHRGVREKNIGIQREGVLHELISSNEGGKSIIDPSSSKLMLNKKLNLLGRASVGISRNGIMQSTSNNNNNNNNINVNTYIMNGLID